MEINKGYLFVFFMAVLLSCATSGMDPNLIHDLYVDDFQSDDISTCKISDVDLSHHQAKLFFQKARQVDYKIIQDHYEVGPCYIEGPLVYEGEPCSWKIRPGATGSITCKKNVWYFVCDNCQDLFESK